MGNSLIFQKIEKSLYYKYWFITVSLVPIHIYIYGVFYGVSHAKSNSRNIHMICIS